MGLAASQGRYLCLTARMSDLVYEGQQISQQRLILATETQEIAEEYNEKMNNTVIQTQLLGKNGEYYNARVTYDIITNTDPMKGVGMRIVDADGQVVVPAYGDSYLDTIEVANDNDTKKYTSVYDFAKNYLGMTSDEIPAFEAQYKSMSQVYKFYTENKPDEAKKMKLKSSLKSDNERFVQDQNCDDPDYVQEMLKSGQWFIQQRGTGDEWDTSPTWQGSSQITEVLDTSDDAAAESEYESKMQALQKKDKMFEMRLEQIQTEENSVETEIDSIKQVITKNIENSFKTFA